MTESFDRPAFPPVNLSDTDLAKLGFVSACEARARSSLVWSLKALEAVRMNAVPSLQRLPIGKILERVERHRARLSAKTMREFDEVKALHEPTQTLRNRVIHGIWGHGTDDQPVLLDMRTHKGFAGESLQDSVILNAKFAETSHKFLMQMALEIQAGSVVPADRERGCMAVQTGNGLVYF